MRRAANMRVGLDVGITGARVVALSESAPDQFLLHRASVVPFSSSMSQAEQLRDVWRKARGSGRVRVNLGPVAVIVQQGQFPDMPPEDLQAAARIEAEQLIPDLDAMVLDSQVIGRTVTADGEQLRVLMVAAPRDAVSAREELLRAAKVPLHTMAPDGLALANAVLALLPPVEGPEILLDIGREGTNLVAVMPQQEAMAPIVRHVPGGTNMHETPAAATSRDSEAEKDRWLREVERSIQFVSGKLDTPLQRILVVGDGASADPLLEWVNENLAVPVQVWNPLALLGRTRQTPGEHFIEQHGPHMAVAVGLALMDER